jgi:transcriptional regulator of NAD metabolism
VAGGELARLLGVSRQVVVQDIAVLRAAGASVVPSPRGYRWEAEEKTPANARLRARVAVRHRPDETLVELLALVDSGVRVLDVIVEHPLYGELRGTLDLATRAEVETWNRARERHGASVLSALTGGVHLHTLEAAEPLALATARERLHGLGFLLL